jgi:hypothetical protein
MTKKASEHVHTPLTFLAKKGFHCQPTSLSSLSCQGVERHSRQQKSTHCGSKRKAHIYVRNWNSWISFPVRRISEGDEPESKRWCPTGTDLPSKFSLNRLSPVTAIVSCKQWHSTHSCSFLSFMLFFFTLS